MADRLVELALGAPAGLVPDIAGPRVYGMDELVRSYLRARGRRRLIVPVRFGGGAYRAIRAGAHLAPDRAVGRRTWEEFLAARSPPTRDFSCRRDESRVHRRRRLADMSGYLMWGLILPILLVIAGIITIRRRRR